VPITAKEKELIEKQKIPGFDFEKQKSFIAYKGTNLFQIAKKPDGGCVFLDSENMCLIHRHCGEKIKPLACRLHPFDIHNWEDGSVSAALKFDCPSAARCEGREMSERLDEIKAFSKELASGKEKKAKAIYCSGLEPTLDKLTAVAKAYEKILFCEDFPLGVRLCAAARILEFQSSKTFHEEISNAGEAFINEAESFISKTGKIISEELEKTIDLNLNENLIFRYLLSGYARVDENISGRFSMISRIKRSKSVVLLMFGGGNLKELNESAPDSSGIDPIASMKNAEYDESAIKIFMTYLSTKLSSMHFCGTPVMNLTFEEGMRHLLLCFPVICAFSSVIAQTENRKKVIKEDMSKALIIVDHTFGRSPFFKLKSTKNMEKKLCSSKTFSSLIKLLRN
jgi:Fe-S-cluster containining protein